MATTPIRIGFVIDTIDEPTGGTEKQLIALLERLDRTRFEPRLYCLCGSEWLRTEGAHLPWVDLGIHVTLRPRLWADIDRTAARLRGDGIEVVQTHFRDGNLVGVLAASRARVPVIVSTRRGVPYWGSTPGLWFLRHLNRRVTWFIANSRATRDHYARVEGIDPDRFDVIHNGLEVERFHTLDGSARAALRTSLELPASARVVGIVANLRPVKGIDDFVRAAHRVLERHPDTYFVVIGQGEEEPKLRALVQELGVGHRVRLLGVRRDVPELLQVFDVGVLASHFESFSNAILEYVAAGLPAVVTDVGGAREVVSDGVEGFVVPPRDPAAMAARLCELLDHAEGPRAWAARSGLAGRFAMPAMVAAHEAVYERELARVRHGADRVR